MEVKSFTPEGPLKSSRRRRRTSVAEFFLKKGAMAAKKDSGRRERRLSAAIRKNPSEIGFILIVIPFVTSESGF